MGCHKPIKDYYEYALKSNLAWASYINGQNPGLFERTKENQYPKILWIGCSDSRVPESTILGLEPGDVFVQRNIGNIINSIDINATAVIEYAVKDLKVQDIIVCGHTQCGGVKAALSDCPVGGVIDNWIAPIRTLRRCNAEIIDNIKGLKERSDKLCELNIEMSVSNLMRNYAVQKAIMERGLEVHGCIYDVATGKIRDLCLGTDAIKKLSVEETSVAPNETHSINFKEIQALCCKDCGEFSAELEKQIITQ